MRRRRRYAGRKRSRALHWWIIALALIGLSLAYEIVYEQDALNLRTAQRFTAHAIDGDTLRTNDTDIRIMGIDAPELHQTCRDAQGQDWACGREAQSRLRALTLGLLQCKMYSTDRYGRALARCSTQTVPDVGEAMVRAGYAVSYLSPRYWMAELEARRNGRGIWRGSFEQPQDWRRRQEDRQ